MSTQHFDHIIVGSGQATGTLIGGLPKDESIAVIEGGKVGGTCVNVGCTPTKTLVASAKVAHMARRGAEYGVLTGDVQVDFSKVMARMDKLRNGSREGLTRYIESLPNVTLFRGWAAFEDEKTLCVDDEKLTGERVYVNVGGRARDLNVPGLETVDWLDNVSILNLEHLPEHLIVVGGSYIGLELGQVFKRLGSKVTVLQHSERIISREDEDVSEAMLEILQEEGIDFLFGADMARVEKMSNGVKVQLKDGRELTGSHLLLAVGRVPNTDSLGLDKAGIETDKRDFIPVNNYCQTNVENIFAVGDVNGRGAFTHTSVNDAEIVLDKLYPQGRKGLARTLSERVTIYAMFTDPPLGRVGLTETEALKQGYKVLKATRTMSSISRAKEMGETKGFVKLLVDAETDLILGASILGVNGDEIINMFAAIMTSHLPCLNYRKTVLVHPTVSELMPWVLDGLEPIN